MSDTPERHVTSEYLYTIVNTLDATFFAHVIAEIEANYKLKLSKKAEKVINIDKEMLDLLKSF